MVARHLEETVLSEYHVAGHLPASPAAAPFAAFGAPESQKLLEMVLASLDDDKAEDVVSIPLTGRSSIADYMVVATGRSSRQVGAIAEKLADRLKHQLGLAVRTEGKELGDWVLIDAGDVVVHVFRPEVREFYQLEKMWSPQPRLREPGVAAQVPAADSV